MAWAHRSNESGRGAECGTDASRETSGKVDGLFQKGAPGFTSVCLAQMARKYGREAVRKGRYCAVFRIEAHFTVFFYWHSICLVCRCRVTEGASRIRRHATLKEVGYGQFWHSAIG